MSRFGGTEQWNGIGNNEWWMVCTHIMRSQITTLESIDLVRVDLSA